jgi:hypothetical protein
VIKITVLVSNENMRCKIMSSVWYPNNNKKSSLSTYFILLLSLIFASWCLPSKTSAVVGQHIWTQFSTVPSSMWEMSEWKLCQVHGRLLSHFQGKKIKIEMHKIEFQ